MKTIGQECADRYRVQGFRGRYVDLYKLADLIDNVIKERLETPKRTGKRFANVDELREALRQPSEAELEKIIGRASDNFIAYMQWDYDTPARKQLEVEIRHALRKVASMSRDTERLLVALRSRLSQGIAWYRAERQGTGDERYYWWVTEFTHEQIEGNLKQCVEMIDAAMSATKQ